MVLLEAGCPKTNTNPFPTIKQISGKKLNNFPKHNSIQVFVWPRLDTTYVAEKERTTNHAIRNDAGLYFCDLLPDETNYRA